MRRYRLVAQPAADRDIEGAFAWYESERVGLGLEFLDQLRHAYGRIADGPSRYREIRAPFGERSSVGSRTRSTLRWSKTSS